MPKGLIEGLLTFLGILFFFVLPMVARARSAARRGGQLRGLPLSPPGRPSAPEVAEEAEEEPEEEPVTVAAAAPIPAPPRPAVTLPPEPSTIAPPRMPTPLAAPGGLGRLRRLTPWQRAVVWAEILGPPRGLQ